MSFNTYNPHDRYRRRAAERVGSLVVALGVLGLFFGFGFWLGQVSSKQGAGALKQEVQLLQAQSQQMEADLTEARSQAQTAVMRFEQLQETYNEKIPEGPVSELLDLVRKQIEEGRDPERLAFLIRSARPPRNCSEIDTRRFVVSTPANEGPDNQITIGDGLIVIKATGVSARNDKGQPEAWYDPAHPISVTFTTLGGKAEIKKGVLPLHHSAVVSDREYRFTVSDGARSFAKVTYDSCDYP